MDNDIRKFGERLNQALDASPLDIPIKGEGRQVRVGKLFSVNQKTARRWLEGEGFPTLEKSIEIARKLDLALEWLLTGRGEKRIMEPTSMQLAELLDLWHQLNDVAHLEILNFAKFLVNKSKIVPSIPQPQIDPSKRH